MEFTWQRVPEKERGVIVGCDEAQEWLLPWWWERYSAENDFPVVFADFGMSQQARDWCARHGELIVVNVDTAIANSLNTRYKRKRWDALYGASLWVGRRNWFKKPFACLASPFHSSVWLDLDCEVLRPIDSLFDQCDSSCSLALSREYAFQHLPKLHPSLQYNSGVIVFNHGIEIIQKWAEDSLKRGDRFVTDDKLLSALIWECQWLVSDLPEIYNWKYIWGVNVYAIIYHWLFASGKEFIAKHGGIKPNLSLFLGKNG